MFKELEVCALRCGRMALRLQKMPCSFFLIAVFQVWAAFLAACALLIHASLPLKKWLFAHFLR